MQKLEEKKKKQSGMKKKKNEEAQDAQPQTVIFSSTLKKP